MLKLLGEVSPEELRDCQFSVHLLSLVPGVFVCSWPQVSLCLCLCVCTCVFTRALDVEGGYGGVPLRSCFLFSVSPTSACLPLPLPEVCVTPVPPPPFLVTLLLGCLTPNLFPSPPLLPEASSQQEECGLVRPLKASLGLGILFPIPSPRFQGPLVRGPHSGS